MVVMGHVINSYGICGWIKVCPYTEFVDGLLNYSTWWLGNRDNDWHEVCVDTGYINGGILHVKLREYVDRTQAIKLRGIQIAVPRNLLPTLPEKGERGYYWSDLIGTHVINLNNEDLGKVIGLLETGANDVLRVLNEEQKEILIPFIEQAIIKVNLDNSQIVVDWDLNY